MDTPKNKPKYITAVVTCGRVLISLYSIPPIQLDHIRRFFRTDLTNDPHVPLYVAIRYNDVDIALRSTGYGAITPPQVPQFENRRDVMDIGPIPVRNSIDYRTCKIPSKKRYHRVVGSPYTNKQNNKTVHQPRGSKRIYNKKNFY
jgi:hypothetical protein